MDKATISDKALEHIANFWFDQFINTNHDNGGRDINSALCVGFRSMLADDVGLDADLRPQFAEALRKRTREKLTEPNAHATWLDYSTDYHPSGILKAAMEDCGIHESRASIKTTVCVKQYGVIFGPGYAAPMQRLCHLDGELYTKRWLMAGEIDGRKFTVYSYSEYAHHGAIATHLDYHPAAEYEERVECFVDNTWVLVIA